MKIRFLTPAQWEVNDAVRWYNEQRDGLGLEFLDQLDTAIRRVAAFLESYPEIDRNCGVVSFPGFLTDLYMESMKIL